MINKRIQVLVGLAYPVSTGIEVNNLQTYRYFSQRRWAVKFYTTKDNGYGVDVLKPNDEIYGITIYRVDKMMYRYFPWMIGVDLSSESIFCLHGTDIFPFYFFYIVTIILKLARKKKYKLIYTPHGIFALRKSGIKTTTIVIKTFLDKTLGSFLINHSVDKIRAISEWEKNELVQYGIKTNKIYVVHNGLEKLESGSIQKRIRMGHMARIRELGRYLVQVGRVTQVKNQITAIKTLKFIPKDVKLLFIGPVRDQKYKKLLDQYIDKNDLTKRVVFAGEINDPERYIYMKNAIAMVHLPSLEGFGNSVHEAVSLGVPCIVSKGTALEEVVTSGKNGFLVDHNDYLTTAKKINYILDKKNKKILLSIKSKSIQSARGHTWESVSLILEKLYLNL